MEVAAIVQARMGSTRLPRKVLADIAGETMLARVVGRVKRSRLISRTMVATTRLPADDAVMEECRRLGVEAFRGSEQDVLDRYCRAAEACGAEAVVRITADCPLIDPEVIDETVRCFLEAHADLAWNDTPVSYPRGLDVEVIDVGALRRAWHHASLPHERVHVTPYIYSHPELFRIVSLQTGSDYSRQRWTVDTTEDLALARAVYRHLGSDRDFGWREVQRLLSEMPELLELNRGVRQKRLEEG